MPPNIYPRLLAVAEKFLYLGVGTTFGLVGQMTPRDMYGALAGLALFGVLIEVLRHIYLTRRWKARQREKDAFALRQRNFVWCDRCGKDIPRGELHDMQLPDGRVERLCPASHPVEEIRS
jgi:hypothetical protein